MGSVNYCYYYPDIIVYAVSIIHTHNMYQEQSATFNEKNCVGFSVSLVYIYTMLGYCLQVYG